MGGGSVLVMENALNYNTDLHRIETSIDLFAPKIIQNVEWLPPSGVRRDWLFFQKRFMDV